MNRAPAATVAAIDLGSNSFHLIVARIVDDQVHMVDRLKETVRLAEGLDAANCLTEEAASRALASLARLGERVRHMPRGSVRVVGTNTFRKARNTVDFIDRAREALGHPIEIINGREEARLIYLGVSHSTADADGKRLVVDIGGGSTELIIGEHFEPLFMESLHMGCVSVTEAHFRHHGITLQSWRQAIINARLELQPIANLYRRIGWQSAIGSSGSVQAVAKVVRNLGGSRDGISLANLHYLRDVLIDAGSIDNVELEGLSSERVPVFPGGVAVLQALFESLEVETMAVAEGALREGLIYDLLGRLRHEDVRGRTIRNLMQRFAIDTPHAGRVETTALVLFEWVAADWALNEDHADILRWAANLHEIGLAISHSQYHKHGGYLLENADLPGFSRQEQHMLAVLVRAHRRKFPTIIFDSLPSEQRQSMRRLAIMLRLAVLLNRGRTDEVIPLAEVCADRSELHLGFHAEALEAQPLTRADLDNERGYLEAGNIRLSFS